MSVGKYRVFILAIICFLLLTGVLIAGTTGKIAGRIVDKESGNPLPGVNVVVKGTYLGAATDVDGYYAILSVAPGMHTVEASMIGFATVTVNEVRVLIDQTAPVNIEMVSEVIEAASVVIIAERNLVKKDVSTSVSAVQPEEIEALPVTNLSEVVSLQAGVEKGLMVRGGGADELLFQVDGVTFRDPRNNQPISTIPLSSIQELSIERGGFNAEYGQVRSGIVNTVQKEGDVSKYAGMMTLKYSPPQQKYFGISVYDPYSMWNRPYMDPAVCWRGTKDEPLTVDVNANGKYDVGDTYIDSNEDGSWTPSAWNEFTQRQYPDFDGWNAISKSLLEDGDPTNDLTPAACQRYWEWTHRRRPVTDQPDYNIDGTFGGPVPFVSKSLGNLRFLASFRLEREMLLIPLSRDDYKDYVFSLKINSDINSKMKLMITSTMGKSYNVPINQNDQQFWNFTFGINGTNVWDPTDFMRTPLEIAAVTNEQRPSRIFCNSWYSQSEVSHFTFAAKLTHFLSSSTFYEASFEHVTRNYLTGPIRNRDLTKRYEIAPGYFVDEAPFGYNPLPNADLTGMFFGGHSSTARDSSNIYSYVLKGDLTSQLTKEHMLKAGIEFSYYHLNLDYGLLNVYFQNVNWVKEQWNPYRMSMYVQDKIEALGFIANLGLRMDLSNPNTDWVTVDPFDKAYYSRDYSADSTYAIKRAKVDVALSPRLGISHPITENSKLYFNYGHFKELPAYEEIFRIGRSSGGDMRNYGNPNLIQARTISYELGYDHVIATDFLIQLAAFYHDITDQQGYTQYSSDRKSIAYFIANNNNYRDIRGFELTLRKAYGAWVRGFANYTYTVITQGAFGKQSIDEDPWRQRQIDQNTTLQYQQKPVPQPRANASLMFLTPSNFGPEVLGIKPAADWSMNILAQWQAGPWFTYQVYVIPEEVNNVQVTDYYNVDLRLNKVFDFKAVSLTFFMEARNLFNFKRMSGESFYNSHDFDYYMQSLHLPTNRAYDNIPGDDRAGDYRKPGVDYQPIIQVGNVKNIEDANIKYQVIYYDKPTKKYWYFPEGKTDPVVVEQSRMKKILDDKAYIDMPNNTSFTFLNPRQFFYGLTLSFKL
jgi:outer membrane receptor protein involved in Fe transport